MQPSPPNRAQLRRDLAAATAAALALGLFSTVGDWIWARFITDGAVVPGVIHGALFFLLIAVVLGGVARSAAVLRRLAVALPVAGLGLAAAFYPLARAVGYLGALIVTWVGMWIVLALLDRWARRGGETPRRALARGLIAAASSGVAFWAVSGMWTAPAADTGYGRRLLYWTLAFLPGLLALVAARRQDAGGRD